MNDGIINGDGTSRLARSVVDFKTRYPTYDAFAEALIAGTLPLDILFNAAGWSQVPDFLNKENLLQDATATKFGLTSAAVLNDVLSLLSGHAARHAAGGDDELKLSTSQITSGTFSVSRGGSGKSSWVANRLPYPSAATTMAQLAFPSVAGSVLRQGTSGAPYWTSIADLAVALAGANTPRMVAGTYTGNSDGDSNTTRTISLGFTPKAVVLMPRGHRFQVSYGEYVEPVSGARAYIDGGGAMVAVTNGPQYSGDGYNADELTVLLKIVTNGFQVYGTGADYYNLTNAEGFVYNYIAWG